ncbi:MAG: isochorismatase family cysteine hydrolase [Clostridium sp.]
MDDKIMELWKKQLIAYCENIENTKGLDISTLDLNNTVICIIDIINGFAKFGPLSSENLNKIIPNVKELVEFGEKNKMPMIAYRDCHSKDNIELKSYPEHCICGTEESELVDELKGYGIQEIKKISTNGFISKNTVEYLNDSNISNFIIVGGCTDICIYQYALSLKAYLNEKNKEARIIIPVNMVATFDLPYHNAELNNMIFLNSMMSNGIEVIKKINF